MMAPGFIRLCGLAPFLARPSVVRVVSPHGVEILYEGKAGELKDALESDTPPKREGKAAVAEWRRLREVGSRYVTYGRSVSLVAEDWAMEFVPEASRQAFLAKNAQGTFTYLFLEVSEPVEEEGD